MSDCREFRERMSASLDHPLDAEEQKGLEAHLAGCSSCRTEWEELQWTHRQLKGLEPVEAPSWMTSKIMARVRAESAPRLSIWQRFLLPLARNPQLQVASLLLLAVTGYYLIRTPKMAAEFQQKPELKKEGGASPSPTAPPIESARSGRGGQRGNFAAEPAQVQRGPLPAQQKDQEQSKEAAADKGEFAPPPTSKPLSRDMAAPTPAAPALSGSVGAAAGALAESTSRNEAQESPAKKAQKAAPAMEYKAKADSAVRAQSETSPSQTPSLVIRLVGADLATAKAEVERAVDRAGGSLLPPQEQKGPRTVGARLDSRRLKALVDLLGQTGRVVEQPEDPGDPPVQMTVFIRW